MTTVPARLTPTEGALGAVYQTADGKFYVRTRTGNRNVDASVGSAVASAQTFLVQSYRATRKLMLIAGVVGLIAGFVAGALLL